VKVFVSSVIKGFEEYREAAVAAIRSLLHIAIRNEDFSAKDSSSQTACLGEVRDADVILLLLEERYGWPQPSGLSATHEEYQEAKKRKPVLAFIKNNVKFEARQAELVKEVEDWNSGLFVAYFSDTESLRNEVTSALRDFEVAQVTHPFDEKEVAGRAYAAVPDSRHSGEAKLVISVARDLARASFALGISVLPWQMSCNRKRCLGLIASSTEAPPPGRR
jgi:hypothetical protein